MRGGLLPRTKRKRAPNRPVWQMKYGWEIEMDKKIEGINKWDVICDAGAHTALVVKKVTTKDNTFITCHPFTVSRFKAVNSIRILWIKIRMKLKLI